MENRRVNRRDVIRFVSLAAAGSVFVGFGRFLAACSDNAAPPDARMPQSGNTPTDDDEFVPAGDDAPPPKNGGSQAPTVPNPSWEARAKALEDEQKRVYGNAVFSAAAPGIFKGKERSHIPKVTPGTDGMLKTVTVLVEHVMGENGLDAGKPDAAPDAPPPLDPDAGDADMDAGEDASMDGGMPMDAGPTAVHFITTIYVRAMVNGKDTVVGLWEFASTDAAPPSVKLPLPDGVTEAVAYEWCTLHGLWKTEAIKV